MGVTEPEGVREVRLLPEFADLYPELRCGEWMPARESAEALVRRARHARILSIHRRTFDASHFEFRGGGTPRGPTGRHTRSRVDDR